MARTKNTPTRREILEQGVRASTYRSSREKARRRRAAYDAAKAAWEAQNPGQPYLRSPPPAVSNRPQNASRRALNEIRHYQNAVGFLLPKLTFQRLVREITQECSSNPLCYQFTAMLALQEAAEAYLVAFFEAANMCAIHAKRVTVKSRDMELVRWFCKSQVVSGFDI